MLFGRPATRGMLALVAASLVLAQIAPLHQAVAQSLRASAMSRAEYDACQTRDEAGFRQAIEAVTVASLERGLMGLDYKAIIADEWRRGALDDVMGRRVDAAVEEIRSESSWTDLIGSLASSERAQQLATTAAERVYRSSEIKTAIEQMAGGIGKAIGERIELATVDAAEPATQCLQAFLGQRFGSTVARTVSTNAGKEFVIDASKGSASITTGQVLAEGKEGIAGAVILIVRRQLANMASRVGQRLLGAVLGRVISVVAGGIGVVLIAKDIWELRNGVLPIVATEMKSPATRDKVQDELAKAMREQIGEHVKEIGQRAADRVIEIWQEFRRAHAKVLELAEKDDGFKRFIDTVKPQNLARLDEAVALVLVSEGEPAVLRRLADGSLHEAVERLPPAALEIARDQRSLDVGFKWAALAGDRLPKVIEHEIHRRNGPAEFNKASLNRILSLDDRVAIGRLASLKAAERDLLLELPDGDLKKLGRALNPAELTSLSTYLAGLERNASQRLLAAVAHSPAKMQIIAPQTVRDAILASRDQAAAVGIMLKADGIFDVGSFIEEATLVHEGKVSPRLLVARYPTAIGVLALLSLILLMLLWRLIFGRRRVVVAQVRG